jgi:hypothetical protein
VIVRFPDKSILAAPTADELLTKWNAEKWNRDRSATEFRNELSRRAWVWDAALVDPTLPAEQFIRELADAHLLTILEES